jgi:hypothetical protein
MERNNIPPELETTQLDKPVGQLLQELEEEVLLNSEMVDINYQKGVLDAIRYIRTGGNYDKRHNLHT